MRILLVKTSSLGDVIHNLPVVSDLALRFPGATIDWVVEESFAEIPRLHSGVAKVIPVAVRRWRSKLFSSATWTEIGAFRRSLRVETYDYVIDTQGLFKSAVITWFAKGERCGYDAPSARESGATIAYDKKFAVATTLHAVERNRSLAALATGSTLSGPLNYGIAARSPAIANEPVAVLLTATSRDDKLWPDADWTALGVRLSASGFICKLPGGNVTERNRAANLAKTIPNAVALPALSLTDLAQSLADAQIVIGVDTGLVHLAAALGRPTIALYCASDPLLTGVHASTPHLNLGKHNQPPSLDAVLGAVTALRQLPA